MAGGIDATVVLGLAGKASQVFSQPDSYLSFPFAPIGIERSRLQALIADPFSPEGELGLVEFALIVNEIPAGPLWRPDGDRLWDVYGDVLTDVQLAEIGRTPVEEADYQRACSLLYQAQPDGAVGDAPIVVAYQQYRDAYLAAAQEYNNRKGQAELTSDPAVRNQWAMDEPLLQEQVTRAEQGWAAAGHRAEVEDARRVLRELGSRSPLMVWAGYRKLFDPDLPEIYFRTAVDGSMYLPTGYLPTDVVDADWPTITVTRAELTALAASAPQALRAQLGGGSEDAGIEQVSFEYSSVSVNRPWFASAVFNSRAWRFHEPPPRVLSDGGKPPAGECTAYVSGLVLGRNIAVRRRAGDRPMVGLGFLPAARISAHTPIARPLPANVVLGRVQARALRIAARGATFASRNGPETTRVPAPGVPGKPAVIARSGTASTGPPSAAAAHELHTAPSVRPLMRPLALKQIPGVRQRLLATAVQPFRTDDASTRTDPRFVYVLALICRLLPKCPDPDPHLQW